MVKLLRIEVEVKQFPRIAHEMLRAGASMWQKNDADGHSQEDLES
jgi:hypothetical protein